MNWYAFQEIGRQRNQDDIRNAKHERLIAEALRENEKITVKDKVFGAIGAFLVRSGGWLQKQSRVQQRAINSIMDASNQNGRVCATC